VFEELGETEFCSDAYVRVRIEGGCKDLGDGIYGSHDDGGKMLIKKSRKRDREFGFGRVA
jgi:hypothetical protein